MRQFAAERYENERYTARIDDVRDEAIATGKAQAVFDGGVHIAANAAILAVLGAGGTLVVDGALTAGDLTSF